MLRRAHECTASPEHITGGGCIQYIAPAKGKKDVAWMHAMDESMTNRG